MNRPISGSDFGYEIPLKETTFLQTITGSQETVQELKQQQQFSDQDQVDG